MLNNQMYLEAFPTPFPDGPDFLAKEVPFTIRDFSAYVPGGAEKWRLQYYQLLDGTEGQMLAAEFRTESLAEIPPEVCVPVSLEGWYQIFFGVPVPERKPYLGGGGYGIDVAFGDSSFMHIFPEYGSRYGRYLVERDCEYFVYYRTMYLNGSILRLRVPYDTYSSGCYGLVRAALSSVRFVKSNPPPEIKDCEKAKVRRGIMTVDGFSHYWAGARPGNDIDNRIAEYCTGSDIGIIMQQTPCTGITPYRSRLTSYIGQGLSEEDLNGKRTGDIRIIEYIKWAIENEQESYRVMPERCRQAGIEFHASIRANLFFDNGSNYMSGPEKFLNGDFWAAHPELRIKRRDGSLSAQLDYAKPEARAFITGLFEEILTEFNGIDGINLDATRWPPIMDVENHDFNVFLTFVRELREMTDRIGAEQNRKIKFSVSLVDGYHAHMSLKDQKIDYDGLVRSKLLDFVCVQAFDMKPYVESGGEFGLPVYAISDAEVPYRNEHSMTDNPTFKTPDGNTVDDPAAGEEFMEQPPIGSYPTPQELDMVFLMKYKAGAAGVYLCNLFLGDPHLRRLGHVDELALFAKNNEFYGQTRGQHIIVFK